MSYHEIVLLEKFKRLTQLQTLLYRPIVTPDWTRFVLTGGKIKQPVKESV